MTNPISPSFDEIMAPPPKKVTHRRHAEEETSDPVAWGYAIATSILFIGLLTAASYWLYVDAMSGWGIMFFTVFAMLCGVAACYKFAREAALGLVFNGSMMIFSAIQYYDINNLWLVAACVVSVALSSIVLYPLSKGVE